MSVKENCQFSRETKPLTEFISSESDWRGSFYIHSNNLALFNIIRLSSIKKCLRHKFFFLVYLIFFVSRFSLDFRADFYGNSTNSLFLVYSLHLKHIFHCFSQCFMKISVTKRKMATSSSSFVAGITENIAGQHCNYRQHVSVKWFSRSFRSAASISNSTTATSDELAWNQVKTTTTAILAASSPPVGRDSRTTDSDHCDPSGTDLAG